MQSRMLSSIANYGTTRVVVWLPLSQVDHWSRTQRDPGLPHDAGVLGKFESYGLKNGNNLSCAFIR